MRVGANAFAAGPVPVQALALFAKLTSLDLGGTNRNVLARRFSTKQVRAAAAHVLSGGGGVTTKKLPKRITNVGSR